MPSRGTRVAETCECSLQSLSRLTNSLDLKSKTPSVFPPLHQLIDIVKVFAKMFISFRVWKHCRVLFSRVICIFISSISPLIPLAQFRYSARWKISFSPRKSSASVGADSVLRQTERFVNTFFVCGGVQKSTENCFPNGIGCLPPTTPPTHSLACLLTRASSKNPNTIWCTLLAQMKMR